MIPNIVWLWVFYFLGFATYVLKRAGMAVRGPNAVASRRQYIRLHWDVLLIRGA